MDEHRFDDDGGTNHEPLDYCTFCDASSDEDHKPDCPKYPWDLEVELEPDDAA